MHFVRHIRQKLFLGIWLCSLLVAGCGDGGDTIRIDILSPIDGAAVPSAALVSVSVQFTAEDELHDIELDIKRASDDSLVYRFDQHTHQATFLLNEVIDLSMFPAGTTFRLEAVAALDEFATDEVSRSILFSLP